MDKIFTLKNYKIASLVFAFLFLFFGVFQVNDATKFSFDTRSTPSIIAIVIGLLFLIVSIVIYFELGIDIFNLTNVKIKKINEGKLCVQIERTCIIVHFNKLELVEKKQIQSLFYLPMNILTMNV
jgi:hypothetical protein